MCVKCPCGKAECNHPHCLWGVTDYSGLTTVKTMVIAIVSVVVAFLVAFALAQQ